MKTRLWILTLCLCLSLSCGLLQKTAPETAPQASSTPTQTTAPTYTPSPPEVDESAAPTWDSTPPEKVHGEEVMLWASGASASAAAGEKAYHADQALAAPNTLACGNFVTAWQPADDALEATLTLSYDQPILPAEIHVAQSYQPGQITLVEILTPTGEAITIYDASEEAYAPSLDCPRTNVFWTPDVDTLVEGVRLTVSRPSEAPWTQIDAVGILGWVHEPVSTTAEATPPPAEEDFYTPTYFTNKNQVTSLVFVGGQLWVGSEGGLTAWDTTAQTYQAYTAAEGLPQNRVTALTACQQGGAIYAGGRGGIAFLSLDGAPRFTPIDHPDADSLGPVTALRCDEARGHLWVGYTGHLSRYHLGSGAWEEFTPADGLPGDTVRSIQLIGEDIWVATAYGAAVLRQGETLTAYTPDNSDIPSPFIHAIAGGENGRLWMASSDGLIAFDPNEDDWTLWESAAIEGGGLAGSLMHLLPGPAGTFWLADFFGTICQFDPANLSCQQRLSPPETMLSLTALAASAQGQIALGDLTRGVSIYNEGAWQTLRTDDAILDNAFLAIAYTPDGQIWLAGRSALQHFTANRPDLPWETLALPGEAQAHSFHAASDGLWIGHTRGASFLPYLPGEPQMDLPLGDPETGIANTVTAILEDDEGRVYFGTTSGVSIWDGTAFSFADLLSKDERDKNTYPPQVNALFFERGAMWVGAANGLHRFEAGVYRGSWTETLATLSTGATRTVGAIVPSPTDDCRFLVGVGRDVLCYAGVSFTRVLTLPSAVRSAAMHPNQLWLATAHDGLFNVPVDTSGVVWDLASAQTRFTSEFGSQAVLLSGAHTLWAAGAEGGLLRQRGLWGQ